MVGRPPVHHSDGIHLEAAGKIEPSDVAVALSTAALPATEEWADCPAANISVITAEKKWLVKCKFKGSNGAHVSLTTFGEDYKWATNGVPNAEGNELSVSAVSEGVVIIEGS